MGFIHGYKFGLIERLYKYITGYDLYLGLKLYITDPLIAEEVLNNQNLQPTTENDKIHCGRLDYSNSDNNQSKIKEREALEGLSSQVFQRMTKMVLGKYSEIVSQLDKLVDQGLPNQIKRSTLSSFFLDTFN
jgi:hypothetical protein